MNRSAGRRKVFDSGAPLGDTAACSSPCRPRTCPPPTSGFLLHKHPDTGAAFDVPPARRTSSTPRRRERCTAALLLEVDPIGLVRTARAGGPRASRSPSTSTTARTPRPACSPSRSARSSPARWRGGLQGAARTRRRPPLPLEVHVPALPCRGGAGPGAPVLRAAGLDGDGRAVPLDAAFPEWGDSRYVELALTGTLRLADALNHLYVLLPVLDDTKHYWVGTDEIDKLLRAGEGWLADPPRARADHPPLPGAPGALTRDAPSARSPRCDDAEVEAIDNAPPATAVEDAQPASRLGRCAVQRRGAVLAALRDVRRHRVLDLGCGQRRAAAPRCSTSRRSPRSSASTSRTRALEVAARRLRLDRLPERQRARITLLQSGAHLHRRAAARATTRPSLMEVIEHLDPPAARARARRLRRRRARDGHRHDAERRVQRPLGGPAGRHGSATATTASSGPARSSPTGRQGRRAARIRRRLRRRRRRRPRGRGRPPRWPCSPARAQRRHDPSRRPRSVVIPDLVPGRADRRLTARASPPSPAGTSSPPR